MCVRRYLGFVLLAWFPGTLHAQSAAQPCRAPRLNGGFLVPEQDSYPHETKLTYSCDNGFKPVAEGWWATSTCLNGTWSHEPQCIDEEACFPPDIPNAQYMPDPSGWYKDGHKVWITCDKGYEHKAWDATAKCMNGSWSSVPICEKRIDACGEPPRVPHAVIINVEYQEVYPVDTKVQYECEDGYAAEGADIKKFIYCIFGNWTEGPTCNRRTRPGAGQDGSAGIETDVVSAGGGTQPGDDGTRPDTGHGGSTGSGGGGGHTTSAGSGTPAGGGRGTRPDPGHGGGSSSSWTQPTEGGSSDSGSNQRDRFIAVHHCGLYPTIPNGDVVKQDAMFLKYQCNAFYTQVGSDTVRCHNNGSWSQLPICKAAYCTLTPPRASLVLSGTEYIKEGDSKFISCKWAYYYSRVRCFNGRLFFSQCCEYYYHQQGRCPLSTTEE